MIFENREQIVLKKSMLSLNNVFDLKKKVLFTLNVSKKPFGWVVFFLSILLLLLLLLIFYFYLGRVSDILYLYNVIENEKENH